MNWPFKHNFDSYINLSATFSFRYTGMNKIFKIQLYGLTSVVKTNFLWIFKHLKVVYVQQRKFNECRNIEKHQQ